MDHRSVRADGKNVAGDFDSAFFGGALDFLDVFRVGVWTELPDVAEDGARVVEKKRGEFAVVVPGASDCVFVDFFDGFVEIEIDGRNVGLNAIHSDVALALLLGIIKRVRVEEGPDELAADVFQAKFEGGVLEDRVVAAVEGGRTDIEALLVGDFFGRDEMVGVTGAGGGDGGIEWMVEGIAECDARRSGFYDFGGMSAIEHARLSGHEEEFNTEDLEDTESLEKFQRFWMRSKNYAFIRGNTPKT